MDVDNYLLTLCQESETDEEREKALLTLAQRTTLSKCTKQMKNKKEASERQP